MKFIKIYNNGLHDFFSRIEKKNQILYLSFNSLYEGAPGADPCQILVDFYCVIKDISYHEKKNRNLLLRSFYSLVFFFSPT